MNEDTQLKLQAFFDGELPENEAREVAALLARDAEAAALVTEMRNTRRALAEYEPDVKLPETREFYWSKIQRSIERLEQPPWEREPSSFFQLFRRFLAPTGAAMLAILLIIIGLHGPSGVAGDGGGMTVADPGTFIYHDYANGTTLVWLSYPSER